MLQRFCVCFLVFWLCLLLLLSICQKRTCCPLRCKWPLRSLLLLLFLLFCAADLLLLFCQLRASLLHLLLVIRSFCSVLPLLSVLLVFYLNPNMLPCYEEALYLPRPSLSHNCLFFNLLAPMLESF